MANKNNNENCYLKGSATSGAWLTSHCEVLVFDAFFISWRECSEALLIIALFFERARQSARRDLTTFIKIGLLLSTVWVAALAAILISLATNRTFNALLTIGSAIGVLLMAAGMTESIQSIRRQTSAHMERWGKDGLAPVSIMILLSLLITQEFMEVFVMLHAIEPSMGMATMLTGVTLGLIAAASTAYIWIWAQRRLGLLTAFRVSTILLLVLAVRILIEGCDELIQAPLLPINHHYWLAAVAPFANRGRWHAWLCFALALPPLASFVKGWWRESSKAH